MSEYLDLYDNNSDTVYVSYNAQPLHETFIDCHECNKLCMFCLRHAPEHWYVEIFNRPKNQLLYEENWGDLQVEKVYRSITNKHWHYHVKCKKQTISKILKGGYQINGR